MARGARRGWTSVASTQGIFGGSGFCGWGDMLAVLGGCSEAGIKPGAHPRAAPSPLSRQPGPGMTLDGTPCPATSPHLSVEKRRPRGPWLGRHFQREHAGVLVAG